MPAPVYLDGLSKTYLASQFEWSVKVCSFLNYLYKDLLEDNCKLVKVMEFDLS